MTGNSPPPAGQQLPRINVTRSVQDLIREMQSLQRQGARLKEKIERLLWELYQIEAALLRGAGAAGSLPPSRSARPAELPVTMTFDVVTPSSGAGRLRFDGGIQIEVSETLCILAEVLAAGDGAAGGLAGWKTYEHIGELLQSQLKRPFSPHAVANLLSRVRKRFEDAGADRWLIESDPAFGARLRVKRGAPVPNGPVKTKEAYNSGASVVA